MYVNRHSHKTVKTILNIEGGGIKENDGGSEFCVVHYKNFCNVTMYSQHNNKLKTVKKKKRKKKKIKG
jgi:hypothetical protein